MSHELAFVDIETTGFNRYEHKIIEIAIIKVRNDEIVDTFQTLINPQIKIPEMIEYYTGIKNDDIKNAPSFPDVADKIIDALEGSIFTAHNVYFDYGFFQREFQNIGYQFNMPKLCTVRLSRKFFPKLKKYNLAKLIQELNLQCENHHRAHDDALAILQIYKRINLQFPKSRVTQTIDTLISDGV